MKDVDTQQELVDRLAEEFADRCRRGEQPSIREYLQRHPELADRLREVLPPVALIEQLKRGRPASPLGDDLKKLEHLGDYRIVREVGRGGMGIVYEAQQQSLGRRVALKILPRHSLLDPKPLERFRREAQAAARLHHTNIVPVFGLFESDGLHYYAMQFIEGRGLDRVLDELKRGQAARDTHTQAYSTIDAGDLGTAPQEVPPPARPSHPVTPPPLPLLASAAQPLRTYWDQVATVGVQVANALAYAHAQGTLHRDIKPANLLLDQQGTVWVTDFGLAKLVEQPGVTAAGDVLGTLQYMAPESLHGQSDARSDIYSLGLTLYEMLTLEAPYSEPHPARLLKQKSEHDPPPPRRVNPAVPRDLETIVLTATAREPHHRYPSARALADDLQRFLDDRPIEARRVVALERLWRWCRRNRALASASAAALASLLVAAVVGWWGFASTNRALVGEAAKRSEAETAKREAEANMQLSLDALEEIFAALAPPESEAFSGPPGRPPLGPPEGPGGPPPRGPGADPGPPPSSPRQSADEAKVLQAVLRFYERFAARNATNPTLRRDAAHAHRRVGDLYWRLGDDAAARAAYQRATALLATLADEFPDESDYGVRLVETWLDQAAMTSAAGELSQTQALLDRARERCDALAARFADDPLVAALGSRAYRDLAAADQRRGDDVAAEKNLRRAFALAKASFRTGRPPPHGDQWPRIVEQLAVLLASQNRPRDAVEVLQEATALLEQQPRVPEGERVLAGQYEHLAYLLTELGETDRAADTRRKAAALRPPPGPRPPHPPPR